MASFVQQVQKTNRPLVITSHGRSTVVLMNVNEYESIIEKLELLEDIQMAEKQLSLGKGVPHHQVKNSVLKRIKK